MPQPHICTWRVTQYVLLTLPQEGFADRSITWSCTCGRSENLAGHIKLGIPLATPAFWADVRKADEARGSPQARMAAQQHQWRVA